MPILLEGGGDRLLLEGGGSLLLEGEVSGSAAWTEAADTSAASGVETVTGTSSWTEAADTSAATGAQGYSGTASWTESADTSAASGAETFTGTSAWTEAADTVAASGTSSVPPTGTASWTEAADTSAASGLVFTGTDALLLEGGGYLLLEDGGVVLKEEAEDNSVSGDAAWTESSDTSAAAGVVTIATGTASWTEASDTSAAAGVLRFAATSSWTEAADTAAGTGSLATPSLASFTDTFTSTTISTTKWDHVGTGVTQNNRLLVGARSDYASYILSDEIYTAVSSSVYFDVVDLPSTVRYSNQFWLAIAKGAAQRFSARFDVSGGAWQLSCWHHNGVSESQVGASIAYDAVTMRFVRVRESGGNVLIDTASDPVGTWTNRWSLSTPSWVSTGPVHIGIAGGFFDAGGDSGGTLQVDHVNVVPAMGTAAWTEAADTSTGTSASDLDVLALEGGGAILLEDGGQILLEDGPDVEGPAAWTESADTAAASGAVGTISSTGSWTEAADTMVASGTSTTGTYTGTAAWTESADAVLGALVDENGDPVLDDLGDPIFVEGGGRGFVTTDPAEASGSWTEDDDTSDITAAVTFTGTSSWTESADTSAASGTAAFTGTASWTETADTSAASGLVFSPVTGTSSWTETADTSDGVGLITAAVDGDAAWTEAADTSEGVADAAQPVSGTAEWTEADDIIMSDGAQGDLTFYPPTTPGGGMYKPRDHRRGRRLFAQARNVHRGVTVVKRNGVYQTVGEGPDVAFLASCEEVYLGGHVYEVDGATGEALEEAGFDVENLILSPLGTMIAFLEADDTVAAAATMLDATAASVAYTEADDTVAASAFLVEPGDALVMSIVYSEGNDTVAAEAESIHEETAFTGSNGAAWPSPFAAISTSSGSTATIQSNRGRLTTTTGSYNGNVYRGFTPAAQDFEILEDMVIVSTSNEGYQRIGWRAFTDGREYAVSAGFNTGNITVFEQAAGFAQTIKGQELASGFTNGTVIHFRIRVEGSDHKVRWWFDGASEPGTWDVEFTDTTLTSGAVTNYLVGGNAVATVNADFDNFSLQYIDEEPPEDPPGENSLPAALEDSHGSERTLTFTSRRGAWGTDHFNDELQRYADSGVVFQNAAGATVSSAGVRVIMTASETASPPHATGYISGATNNQDLNVPVSPGDYVQARLKCPVGDGLWSAFWLMPQNGGAEWELDVLEHLGSPTSFDVNHHEDWTGSSYTFNDSETVAIDPTEYFNVGVHLNDDSTDYYCNGVLVLSYPRPVGEDMFVILNLALGNEGSYPGPITEDTPFPSVFEVDSVKVWEPVSVGGTLAVVSLAGAGGGVGSFNMGSNCDHPRGPDFITIETNGNSGGTSWSASNWTSGKAIIENAINAAGADQVIIMGFSIGGMFAQEILHRGETFGGRLKGIILDDPARNWGIFNDPNNAAGFVNPANIPVALYATKVGGNPANQYFVDQYYSDFGYMAQIATAYGVELKLSSAQPGSYAAPGEHRPNTRSTNGTGPTAPVEILDGRWWD